MIEAPIQLGSVWSTMEPIGNWYAIGPAPLGPTLNVSSCVGRPDASNLYRCVPSSRSTRRAGTDGPIMRPSTESVEGGIDENCTAKRLGAAGLAVGAGVSGVAVAGAGAA